MKVVILTQEDIFFIPENIQKIIDIAEVAAVININCKRSLNNMTMKFIRWFGVIQSVKMLCKIIIRRLQGLADVLSGYRLFKGFCSIRHVTQKNSIPFIVTKDVNAQSCITTISKINPELILSFSAPQVIKAPLLNLPRYGIINLHGSLLPDYRGCLPSFWYLYNGEKIAGATVHYMSEKIDDGDIIIQETVSIGNCYTMFDVMSKTKKLGGELMLKAIRMIDDGHMTTKNNCIQEGRYFSWPTSEQAREFRKKGNRLI